MGIVYRAWEREGRRVTVSSVAQQIKSGSSSKGLGTTLSRLTSPNGFNGEDWETARGCIVGKRPRWPMLSVRKSVRAKMGNTGASRTEKGPVKTRKTSG